MKKKCIIGFLCFIPTVISIIFWDQIPNVISIHFNSFGVANRFAGKALSFIGIPLLIYIGHIIFMYIDTYHIDWIGGKNALGHYYVGKYRVYFMPIISIVTYSILLLD